MDKFLESIIQAAKDAGAKDIDIAKICLDDLTKKIDEMDKLQAVNDDLVIDCIAISDKLGFAFLENTFDISKREVMDIYNPAALEFTKCTLQLQELIKSKIHEMEGESEDVSED